MIVIKECPVCQGTKFTEYLTCKDQTVSKSNFNIVQCETCSFLATSPRPTDSELGNYYLSEAYISHTNQTKTLFDKVYQISRLYTLKWKLNILNKYTQGKNLLDVGCGTGAFLEYSNKKGWNVSGVEPSKVAKERINLLLKDRVKSELQHVEQNDFNAITLWHVLEHLPNLNEALNQISNKLHSTGTIFIAVPNPESPDAKHYQEHWAAYDVPRHLWHFTKRTMEHLLAQHRLEIIKTYPMKLDAFYVSTLSEKYNGSPTFMQYLKGFCSGLTSNLKANNTGNHSSILYIVKKAK